MKVTLVSYVSLTRVYHLTQWRSTQNHYFYWLFYDEMHKIVQYLSTLYTCETWFKHRRQECSRSIYDYNYDFLCHFFTKGENITCTKLRIWEFIHSTHVAIRLRLWHAKYWQDDQVLCNITTESSKGQIITSTIRYMTYSREIGR